MFPRVPTGFGFTETQAFEETKFWRIRVGHLSLCLRVLLLPLGVPPTPALATFHELSFNLASECLRLYSLIRLHHPNDIWMVLGATIPIWVLQAAV